MVKMHLAELTLILHSILLFEGRFQAGGGRCKQPAHPYKEPCARILSAIASGRLSAVTDGEIVQELLYRYGALQEWALAAEMAANLLELVPTVLPVSREDISAAIRLFAAYAPSGVKARDALHAAVMHNNGLTQIISTDSHFDQLPGITRLDPQEISI